MSFREIYNKKIIKVSIISLFGFTSLPYVTYAEGLVKCTENCGYNDLIALVSGVINWAIKISPMLAALTFAYAGFLYITSGGDPGKKSEAHKVFYATILGLIVILAAWLIVKAILSGLGVDPNFNFLNF
jgi:hypothetical protein